MPRIRSETPIEFSTAWSEILLFIPNAVQFSIHLNYFYTHTLLWIAYVIFLTLDLVSTVAYLAVFTKQKRMSNKQKRIWLLTDNLLCDAPLIIINHVITTNHLDYASMTGAILGIFKLN
jgi:hypothetical protein